MQLFASAGTSLFYGPGILEGGTLEHSCNLQRSIGYFLEPLLMLAPFAKRQMCITLHGITNGSEDPSVSKSTGECKVLWGEPEEVPSFAIVAHVHAFAWDSNGRRTG